MELFRLGVGGSGHTRQLVIQTEQVLKRDRRQRLRLFFDLDVFFGFDRLVQSVRPAPTRHQTPGKLVDDHHLAFFGDHIVDVALVQRVRAQRLLHVVVVRDVLRVIQVVDLQQLLHPLDARIGQHRRVMLLIDGIVHVLFQTRNDLIDLEVQVRRLLRRAADDERRTRLIDQDRVHFVDDRVVQRPLHVALDRLLHVVAKVVEAKLVVGAVGDVAAIGQLLLVVGLAVDDGADGHAQELIDSTHPLRVAKGQVVIDGDKVRALALQRVEVQRAGRHQRLAFAGLHLGNRAAI